MPKYIRKPITVEATQWFKMGDHPDVRHPKHQNKNCFFELFQDNQLLGVIYPGDWIVTKPDGEIGVMSDIEFREMYEEI